MIKASNISHFYAKEQVLYDLSFEISSGQFVFLSGESGSGKSTLLSILSTLLQPSKGELFIDGEIISEIKNIDIFRQNRVGFIFQFHYLINYLTVYENIALAATEDKKQNINKILTELKIAELSSRYPNEISGGQRQRVAVARALVNEPKIIFADEPTGSLDSNNSLIVYELLKNAQKGGTTVVVASHDMNIENYATEVLRLRDGKIL
jgi:putative ABC transport system ATP-binding protein